MSRAMDISMQFEKLQEMLDDNKRYIISVQGCSASGKTTLSTHLASQLARNGISVVLISLDNYYKTLTGTEEDLIGYDFDNPAALDWDALKETINSYNLDLETVIEYRRSIKTKICQRIEIPNVHPKIIIVEGIFGFNMFNEMIFNVKEFDPYNTKKIISQEYIHNSLNLTNFNIIKIQLNMEREKVKKIRIQRDMQMGVDTEAMSIARFENMMWPSTLRWVYSNINDPDIVIEGGTFNIEDTEAVVKYILEIFECCVQPHSFINAIKLVLN